MTAISHIDDDANEKDQLQEDQPLIGPRRAHAMNPGELTRGIMTGFEHAKGLTPKEALRIIEQDYGQATLPKRFNREVGRILGIPDTEVPAIKRELMRRGREKQLGYGKEDPSGFTKPTLRKWTQEYRGRNEVHVNDESKFKLCLALELDLEQSAEFICRVLHGEWFNYRKPEHIVYMFFIAHQGLFKNETYKTAVGVIDAYNQAKGDGAYDHAAQDWTGFTKNVLRERLGALCTIRYEDGEGQNTEQAEVLRARAKSDIEQFLHEVGESLDGVRRSTITAYNHYFFGGTPTIPPLKDLYKEHTRKKNTGSKKDTGRTLSDNSYLMDDRKQDRLLWGSMSRDDWLKANEQNKDYDILHSDEILLARQALSKPEIQKNGVKRGNIIVVLFFQFYYHRKKEFDEAADLYQNGKEAEAHTKRVELFEAFYETTDLTLTTQCNMMPLYPSKMFDRMFLESILHSGNKLPDEFLNEFLENFYTSE
jgi:hypothetical protein